MDTDEKLRTETEKWLSKLKNLEITPKNKKGEAVLVNIKAYISDSRHFLEKGDLIRAFEACIWAWALYEISKESNALD